MKHTTFAVDVAKSVFEVAVSHHPGRVAKTHRLTRARFAPFFASRRPATVVMEACGSAHHWGRELQAQGHRVVLLPPHAVRPYVPRNKTDQADAKGILEASRNEAIRPVPVKSVTQQAIAALHRLRSRWLATRTARINTLRGVLREFGIVIPLGSRRVVPAVWAALEDAESGLPDALRPTLAEACDEIRELEARIGSVEEQLEESAEEIPVVARLRTIPGIGLITATALVAVVGDIQRFSMGRHLASYLGLTPRAGAGRPVPCQEVRHSRPASGLGPRPREGPRAQQGGRGPRQQASPHRLGRLEQRHHVPRPGPGGLNSGRSRTEEKRKVPTADCSEWKNVMANRFGPTRGEADNFGGPARPRYAIGSPLADSIMARSGESSTRRPEIRLQSNRIT